MELVPLQRLGVDGNFSAHLAQLPPSAEIFIPSRRCVFKLFQWWTFPFKKPVSFSVEQEEMENRVHSFAHLTLFISGQEKFPSSPELLFSERFSVLCIKVTDCSGLCKPFREKGTV